MAYDFRDCKQNSGKNFLCFRYKAANTRRMAEKTCSVFSVPSPCFASSLSSPLFGSSREHLGHFAAGEDEGGAIGNGERVGAGIGVEAGTDGLGGG